MEQSNFLSLGIRDFLRGLAMAVLTPIITVTYQSIESGELTFNWKIILLSGVSGGLAYIMKNLFTSPDNASKIGGGGIKNPKPN